MLRTVVSVVISLLLIGTVSCGRQPIVGGADASATRTAAPTPGFTPPSTPTLACTSTARPGPRDDASMAYLAHTGAAVLFGGWSNSGRSYFDDTWTWQGGCWTLDVVQSAPSSRTAMAMAYDPFRKLVVAFGGRTNPSTAAFSDETWLWNGQAWSQAASGPKLGFSWAAFDENLQQVVLYGPGADGVGQTWGWDGNHWQQFTGQSPPARTGTAMTFDPSSHRLILFGGLEIQGMTLLNDTWAWNGSTWSKLAPAHSPSPRQSAALASFSARKEVLLVGGNGRDGFDSDAWIWTGVDWSLTNGVGARAAAAAIDVGSAVLLFGGDDLTLQRNDIQLWDGSAWTAG